MTGAKSLLAGLALLALTSPALAQLTQEETARLNDILADPAKLKKARLVLGAKESKAPAKVRAVAKAAEPIAAVAEEPPLLSKNTPDARDFYAARAEQFRSAAPDGTAREFSACPGLNLLLRQDWKDIDLLGCPQTTDDANGAELSYAYDRVAGNQIWNLRGTGAVLYNSMLDTPGLYYTNLGAYLTVNRVFNSSAAQSKADSDKIAFGGFTQFGIQTDTLGTHYFLLRGGAVEDRLKNTSSVNVTASWVPVYDSGGIHIHSPYRPFNATAPFIVEFDPELIVQYAAVTGAGQSLDFNGRAQALRVGPQLTVRMYPLADPDSFWSRLHADLTYHWAYEAYSARGMSWFQSSITYNIDQDGHFGITGSYKKGRDEDTGTLVDIYRIGLTGKI